MSKVSGVAAASKLVGKSQYEPPTITLKEEHNKIFANINTSSSKTDADEAMDAAECIGCGACVASCKNASAMLFVAAKVSHLSKLPQGQPERVRRVLNMVDTMDEEGFGNCTNQYECEASCPKGISVDFIAKMNREYLKASISSKD